MINCLICHDEFLVKNLINTPHCQNKFCKPCLSEWIDTCWRDDREPDCPLCRRKFHITFINIVRHSPIIALIMNIFERMDTPFEEMIVGDMEPSLK